MLPLIPTLMLLLILVLILPSILVLMLPLILVLMLPSILVLMLPSILVLMLLLILVLMLPLILVLMLPSIVIGVYGILFLESLVGRNNAGETLFGLRLFTLFLNRAVWCANWIRLKHIKYTKYSKSAIMIKACAVLCVIVFALSGLCREARYLDSSFEINMPGYLFNIGSRKYLGLDTLNPNDVVLVDNPKKALRFRIHLNQPKSKGGYIISLDSEKQDLKEGDGQIDKESFYSRKVLDVCRETTPRKIIVTNYDGENSSEFFFSLPVLVNENAVQIFAGSDCLSIGSTNSKVITKGCVSYPKEERNVQMFSWVDANTFNRGEDPTNYAPNPYIAVVDIDKVGRAQKDCLRTKKTEKSIFGSMANTPTTLPVGGNGLQTGGIFKMFLGIPPATEEPVDSCVELIDRYGL
ncbi:hypothetical protein NECID01_1468 [Nematocida sp. AWRm77]|nr:hypothetical protein NECID01_1468 [Nematocida sp. AWRm77]